MNDLLFVKLIVAAVAAVSVLAINGAINEDVIRITTLIWNRFSTFHFSLFTFAFCLLPLSKCLPVQCLESVIAASEAQNGEYILRTTYYVAVRIEIV